MSEAAIGITFNEDRSQVLLIKRRDVPIWTFPGGGIESDEKPEKAVVREVREETGIQVSTSRKAAVYSPINRLTETTHVFECTVLEGAPTTSDETSDVGFFPIDRLPKSFFKLHRFWLADALNHPDHTIEKPIHQVTYWAVTKYFICHPLQVIRCALSRIGLPWNSYTKY